MGITTATSPPSKRLSIRLSHSVYAAPTPPTQSNSSLNSMSQGYHQGIFGFSDPAGFDRSTASQDHVAQQSRRDKLRVQQAYDAAGNPTLVPIEDDEDQEAGGIYGAAGVTGANNMLSDMFTFTSAQAGPTATELLAGQISRQAPITAFAADWYGGSRPGNLLLPGSSALGNLQESGMKTAGIGQDPTAAMQLFLMNPAQTRSPSPSSAPTQLGPSHHAYHSFADAPFGGGAGGEAQGLSLTLSSSLQPYEMAKGGDDEGVRETLLYFNNQSSLEHSHHKQQLEQHHNSMQLQGHGVIQGRQSFGSLGMVNVLRNSKYTRPAQELLEEFCSVGRGKVKRSRIGRTLNPNTNTSSGGGGATSSVAAASSSSSKEVPPLSPAERFEQQRKKAKLISMLDEVDRRYNHYCDQMQMVVNSFDSVMGFGAATPYTALAQRAMSRHFRCLKDAIAAQLKQTCELLGDKEGASGSGITKGDTPRLRALDQSLRQQRAFHQMGMMEQEAWRPQRGLPDRSVNLLRAWLFEHFLHPYPSDADKHLLARQTGLSRNQVSNWFINARVRLWKPMIEDMYQQEFKDDSDEPSEGTNQRPQSPTQQQQQQVQRHETTASLSEPNPSTSSSLQHHHHAPHGTVMAGGSDDNVLIGIDPISDPQAEDMYRYGAATALRFGAATGDISLTLGLRHAGGNAKTEKNRFSVREFDG